jgi:SAM-dependent methyltransferase
MSDPPNLAAQLEKIFDYTNTFYHQPPTIDITNPPKGEWGRYDFIISSEVMEHVPPPVGKSFQNLYRLLKPNGVLLLTVPYNINVPAQEHFPDLHEYTLARPGAKIVLLNRRRDGSLETFEDLCFHGGDGSTLELRVYSEESLKKTILNAGFDEVQISAESIPEFGVDHAETWSLPVAARKGKIKIPVSDFAQAYRDARKDQALLVRQLEITQGEYDRYIAFHEESHAATERALAERLEWNQHVAKMLEERTEWALTLDKEHRKLVGELADLQQTLTEHGESLRVRTEEVHQALAERDALLARLAQSEAELDDRLQWVRNTEKLLDERTDWARTLEKEHKDLSADRDRLLARLEQSETELDVRLQWVRSTEKSLDERTAWAMALDKERQSLSEQLTEIQRAAAAERDRLLARLEQSEAELNVRLQWVRTTEKSLDERTAWAMALDKERQGLSEQLTDLQRTALAERDVTHARLAEVKKTLADRDNCLRAQAAEAQQALAEQQRLVEERTSWARSRDKDYEELLTQLRALRARKWSRLGLKLGLLD